MPSPSENGRAQPADTEDGEKDRARHEVVGKRRTGQRRYGDRDDLVVGSAINASPPPTAPTPRKISRTIAAAANRPNGGVGFVTNTQTGPRSSTQCRTQSLSMGCSALFLSGLDSRAVVPFGHEHAHDSCPLQHSFQNSTGCDVDDDLLGGSEILAL